MTASPGAVALVAGTLDEYEVDIAFDNFALVSRTPLPVRLPGFPDVARRTCPHNGRKMISR